MVVPEQEGQSCSKGHTERARTKALAVLKDHEQVLALVRRAARKANDNSSALKRVWNDLQSLIRLVRAWARREYTAVPWLSVLAATTALVYFVNPFDLIPDFISGVGLIDDAALLALVIRAIRDDLDAFLNWEAQADTVDAPDSSAQ